jgi:hypothetical protein
MQIGQSLLDVAADVHCEALPKYVKFTTEASPNSPAYAVVWLKSSTRMIIGLALPETSAAQGLGPPLPGMVYKGLTKYFTVERGGTVPNGFAKWGRMAYHHTRTTGSESVRRRAAS